MARAPIALRRDRARVGILALVVALQALCVVFFVGDVAGDLAAGAAPTQEMRAMMQAMAQDLLAKGKSPEEVADIVFASIEQNRFYILPHPAWDDLVRNRVEQVLARGAVAAVDMVQLQSRRAAGEQF